MACRYMCLWNIFWKAYEIMVYKLVVVVDLYADNYYFSWCIKLIFSIGNTVTGNITFQIYVYYFQNNEYFLIKKKMLQKRKKCVVPLEVGHYTISIWSKIVNTFRSKLASWAHAYCKCSNLAYYITDFEATFLVYLYPKMQPFELNIHIMSQLPNRSMVMI